MNKILRVLSFQREEDSVKITAIHKYGSRILYDDSAEICTNYTD
jgi:hypothetical protein